ncbi:hypothetical protein OVA14_12105 [Agrococcus sp. SL85]|uniref:hypothetical protein n=1 Tax=Agrococcus sp. SL85 TaxID=2995141 RepID=UPI00226D1AA3|nr:hypothetical protein [Agrococcus sp. SL85]WAC66019.1 hypothetical protein OVA14_12105 [Agrococcus sp. SL85]
MPRFRTAALAAAALLLSGCAAASGGSISAACAAPILHLTSEEPPLVVAGDAVALRIDNLSTECRDTGTYGVTPAPAPTRVEPVRWLQDDIDVEIGGVETNDHGAPIAFDVVVPAEARPGFATIDLDHAQVAVIVGDPQTGWDRSFWPEPSISLASPHLEEPMIPGVTVDFLVHHLPVHAPDDSVPWDPMDPPLVLAEPVPILWMQDGVEVPLRDVPPWPEPDSWWTVAVPPEAIPGEARIVLGDSEIRIVVDEP